ncbi:MAG: MFS transporter [Sporocytophaga sp.]|uniref:MFS transporter n=1 Tax=Sporocytophaga sp. TaxID=2231183 RepID=UPI001B06637E|nr:MFS transporter [Sporocytophaga sp.]MBO9700474.1 MFS transporter [Sporocytophaga sp.]
MKNSEDLVASKEAMQSTVMVILLGISFSHMLNDTIQSLIPSIYPLVKNSLHLSFAQLGLITLTFQLTSSVLQPFVGYYTDLNPKPNSLAIGMGFTLIGLILLSLSSTYPMILVSVGLVGVGSAIFHPEASRLAYMASGGKRGFAQSLFQVGGNAGSAIGPLLAASIIVPYGQSKIIWFSLIALVAIIVLFNLGIWYKNNGLNRIKKQKKEAEVRSLPKWTVIFSLGILIMLIFSKYFYMASMSSYFTFYLINKFHVSIQTAQVYLFIFLVSVAAGTLIGGPVGDKIGRKYVIWISILGVAPFTLLLPYANLQWTAVLISCIGLILSSAFSAILVYAQELMPGKVGMISGLFFGLAFAMGGIGSAILGKLIDISGIEYVFQLCSFLPLIGLITAFLPNLEKK